MKNAVSMQDRILDISVNLARIGNWTADAYLEKKDLIARFIAYFYDTRQLARYFVSAHEQRTPNARKSGVL